MERDLSCCLILCHPALRQQPRSAFRVPLPIPPLTLLFPSTTREMHMVFHTWHAIIPPSIHTCDDETRTHAHGTARQTWPAREDADSPAPHPASPRSASSAHGEATRRSAFSDSPAERMHRRSSRADSRLHPRCFVCCAGPAASSERNAKAASPT